MRAILFGMSLSLFYLSVAVAADGAMANYFGNTVLSTGPAGQSHSYYRADHTFETKLGNMVLKGTWSMGAKGQLCRLYKGNIPAGIPQPLCTPFAAHKVGDSWIVTLGHSTRQMTLVAGIR